MIDTSQLISDSRIATNEGSGSKTFDRTSTIEHAESKRSVVLVRSSIWS